MSPSRKLLGRLRLRHFLFLLLLLSGIVPLAVSSLLLILQNREILETQEKSYLTRSAQFLSLELDGSLVALRRQQAQLGEAVLAAPAEGPVSEKLRQPWVGRLLREFLASNPSLVAVRLLDLQGVGPYSAAAELPAPLVEAMDEAHAAALAGAAPVYRFLVLPETGDPVAVAVVPVGVAAAGAAGGDGEPRLVVEAAMRLRRMETEFQREAQGDAGVFLIGRDGRLLWSGEASEAMRRAVESSRLVTDFVEAPLNMTQEYTLELEGGARRMLGRVSPVEEAGWGVVVQRPAAAAFAAVDEMVLKTALSTGVLLALALVIAALATRTVSRPIQQLADTTHEIATGNFGKRVERPVLGREIRELAEDFNRMSGTVQEYVGRLQRAAQENRELFIGLMRSFVAAIDAKDPYTRGHSERVAAYSRTISKHLGLAEDVQHRVWVGALLHDVGKIGIEDRILTKGGVLSEEEYEQMKLHPVIGAQIMSRIEQLKAMIPAIRWHHEAWNGRGYPDGLKGEQIPLMARIVGVADTFDAITTNRPYQRAYDTEFAVETITRLAGARFDAKVVTAFLQAFQAGQIERRAPAPTAPAAEPEMPAAASS